MNLGKFLLSALAGVSLGYGGSLLYRRGRGGMKDRRARQRFSEQVLRASLLKLAEATKESIGASEIYYFIWILERICNRHRVEFPDFGFKVDKGLLYSRRLTGLLRGMLADGRLRLDGDRLVPTGGDPRESLDRLNPTLAAIIDETSRQWTHDFPDEPLVRFGRLFR